MLGTATAHIDRTRQLTDDRALDSRAAVRGTERALHNRAADMRPVGRVEWALAREADLVNEGVGVAGEALDALVVEQLAVVALHLGSRWCREGGSAW